MMTSTDGTGAADNAVAARESQIAAASADRGENGRNGGAAAGATAGSDDAADPWFTPGQKVAGEWHTEAGYAVGTDDYATDYATREWFLPTGRAGLLPDSMTVSFDEEQATPRAGHRGRADAASAPPWAGDLAGDVSGTPPPWENGPWPGPGEPAPARSPVSPALGGNAAQEGTDAAQPPGTRRLPALIVLAGGVAALVLVVIIMVIMTGTPGGSGGCGTYPAAVRQAYSRAMRDLRGGGPASVLATDLGRAASRANESAAAAGQISVRTALSALASDLEQAHADVAASRPVSPDLRQRLAADGTALPASCPG